MARRPNDIFLKNAIDTYKVEKLLRTFIHSTRSDLHFTVDQYSLHRTPIVYPECTSIVLGFEMSYYEEAFLRNIGPIGILSDSHWIEYHFERKFKNDLKVG